MDDETFNMSLRKYLKKVGVSSQQAVERHVREHGDASGRLKVRTVMTIEGHGMDTWSRARSISGRRGGRAPEPGWGVRR